MIFCPICEPGKASGPFTPVLCAECSERNAAQRDSDLIAQQIGDDLEAYMRDEPSIMGEIIASIKRDDELRHRRIYGLDAVKKKKADSGKVRPV